MKYLLPVLVFTSLLFAACQKDQPHLPAEKMKAILTDIYIAESYSMVITQDSTKPGTQKNADSLARFYAEIFQHHHITQQEFTNSMRWYEQHPDELDSVFAKMIPQLGKLQEKR
jgi:hypothetical protein